MSPSDRIIVPLDVPTIEAALAWVDRLPQVSFWKVGLELFVSSGPQILAALKQRQKRIFLDLKLHDIPNTVAGACAAAARYGVDLLTLHGANGKACLTQAQAAVISAAAEAGVQPPRLIAVTLLTSIDARTLAFDLKVPLELADYVLQMALLAKDSGLAGLVCSPQEVEAVRRNCGDDFVVVCPGVRPSWAELGDQRRVLTPAAALQAGADYLVIGRPITAAENPEIAFERICAEFGA
jgi:orotidine-5'-phosphate decarboxylase